MMQYAFACRTCGRLHPAEHAGESDTPHACTVCGAGVSFTPQGDKKFDAANWEVLDQATPERLAELGLTPADVAPHQPDPDAVAAENLRRAEEAKAKLFAKRERWGSKPVTEWQQHLNALHAKHDALDAKDVGDHEHAAHEHAKSCSRQAIAVFMAGEWTPRDDAHLAEVQSCIERRGYHAGGKPKSVLVSARDRGAISDRT